MTRSLRYAVIAFVAFFMGSIASPMLAGTALSPITLQPGQQITIIAADLPTSTPTVAPTPTVPTVTPSPTPTASPTIAPTPTPTVAPTATPTVGPTPTPDPNAMPTSSLPGWNIAFTDDYNTWSPPRYAVYPTSYHDTTGHGQYTPSIISASGGNLNIAIQTVNGIHEVAAFIPLVGSGGDVLGMRYSFRIRADSMANYKGVPLLWPSNDSVSNGEIDGPESDFTTRPSGFVHHQGATSGNDQDSFTTPSGTNWQTWHTYTVEWKPGVSVDMWIDGTLWAHDTTRIPSAQMHLVIQLETSTSGVMPANNVSGLVQLAWLAVWTVA